MRDVALRQETLPLSKLQDMLNTARSPIGFIAAIENKVTNKQTAIIAEVKKRSPSIGTLNEGAHVGDLAKTYQNNEATAISVLTDNRFFDGSLDDLTKVRNAVSIPVLRKDFILTPYQVYESRAFGADCILLIMAALDDETAKTLEKLAISLHLDVLIEVHNASELQRALKLSSPLIGINNRNLATLDIDLKTGLSLMPLPKQRITVAESGFYSREDINMYQNAGCYAFLIGTALMRSHDAGLTLSQLL